MLLLLVVIQWFETVSGDCGYVDLSATVGSGSFSFPVGEFILSANKCQSISAQLDVFGSTQSIDGAIKFACDSTARNMLTINEYDNVLCNGEPLQSSRIRVGQDVNIFNDNLYFTLNTLICSDSDCGVDITFSADCSGLDSMGYSHISIPPNSCQTFGDDFNNMILQQIPYQIFPDGTVDGLFQTALQFTCCQQDHSLLIYNYSDSNCLSSTSYNTLRLSNAYNGQCFALGNTQKPFDISSDKAATEDVDNDQVYALKYVWNCDEFVDCSGIEFMDDDQIPNICPDQCLESGYSFSPTSSPTQSPTMHPISGSHGVITVAPQDMRGVNGGRVLSISAKYLLGGMVVVFGVVVVCCIVYTIYYKKKLVGAVDDSQQKPSEVKDSRLEPMIDDNVVEPALINVTDGNNETNAKDSKDSGAGEYVLPSNVSINQSETDTIIKRSSFIM